MEAVGGGTCPVAIAACGVCVVGNMLDEVGEVEDGRLSVAHRLAGLPPIATASMYSSAALISSGIAGCVVQPAAVQPVGMRVGQCATEPRC